MEKLVTDEIEDLAFNPYSFFVKEKPV